MKKVLVESYMFFLQLVLTQCHQTGRIATPSQCRSWAQGSGEESTFWLHTVPCYITYVSQNCLV